MSKDIITIVVLLSVIIWFAVSREASKPSREIKWRKMIVLLSAGSLTTLIITISLFQNLPFLVT